MKSTFYSPKDQPSKQERELMWNQIELAVAEQKIRSIKSIHWKSFWYGSVASVLILLSMIGLFTVFQTLNNPMQNGAFTFDRTYQQAMDQLVSVTPEMLANADEERKPVLESRMKNIQDIDEMIEEIRMDMLLNGSSDIKRRQLKRLYAMKMDNVKELLLNDELSM